MKDFLEQIKKQYKTNNTIMVENRIADRPIIILDTFTNLDDAKEVYNQIENILYS